MSTIWCILVRYRFLICLMPSSAWPRSRCNSRMNRTAACLACAHLPRTRPVVQRPALHRLHARAIHDGAFQVDMPAWANTGGTGEIGASACGVVSVGSSQVRQRDRDCSGRRRPLRHSLIREQAHRTATDPLCRPATRYRRPRLKYLPLTWSSGMVPPKVYLDETVARATTCCILISSDRSWGC